MTDDKSAAGDVMTASVKLSELNHRQLLQVYGLVVKQQEALVARSQDLGRQLDELRGARAEVADQVRKHASDLLFLAALIKQREVQGLPAVHASESVSVGDIVRVDAEAPGTVLEARLPS